MSTSTSTSPAPAGNRSAWRPALRSIAVDAVPPLAIFFVLSACGVSDVLAYTAGGIIPLARLIADRVRRRPFNAISAVIAVLLVVSVVLALVTHDARAVIARGGVIYLAFALIALATVPTRRPALLVLSRHVAVQARPESAARFDEVFAQPAGLRAMRLLTLAWTAGFLVSALACVVCAYTLPVSVAAVVTSFVEPVTALVLTAGTVPFMRRSVGSAVASAASAASAA